MYHTDIPGHEKDKKNTREVLSLWLLYGLHIIFPKGVSGNSGTTMVLNSFKVMIIFPLPDIR